MILDRYRELARDLLLRPGSPAELGLHIQEAVQWIYRAQDEGPDRGVSHSYLIGTGWMRSYPETTGYIIPTMLNWSETTADPEARRRALEMADWELGVQLESGAIPSLADGRPTVFDTGQVIFGWIAAFRTTGTEAYLDAALRAADWLLRTQDADGAWRSPSDPGGGGLVYDARVAWALLELSRVADTDRYATPPLRFLSWALAQEQRDGWFERNCLNDPSRPLLHTIAYTANGLLECGLILRDERLIEAARRTATALLPHIGPDGKMPGRYGLDWRPVAKWACLTGMAQMSIVWKRLDEVASDARFRDASVQVDAFLLGIHDISCRNGGVRGGVRGSYPVNGGYGRYRVLNWATKFFIDAMMLQLPGAAIAFRY